MKKEELNNLPSDVVEIVMNKLKAYDKVYIEYENGKYLVSVGASITKYYAKDHKVIGTVTADEVYTKEERYKNYEEEFGYRPRVDIFG